MSESGNPPFIRLLASNEKKTRTKAIEQLIVFLQTRRAPNTALTLDDALKLWKGLFYAVWMCDRPIPQQNLCTELGSLIKILHPSAIKPWLTAFWTVMAQNWNTEIDVLRMEKFLLLVRRVLAGSFWRLRADSYSEEAQKAVLGTLREWPLEKEGNMERMPIGLRLHVLDIWVDELEREGYLSNELEKVDKKDKKKTVKKSDEEKEVEQAVVEEIEEIVSELTSKFPSRPVRDRATSSLEDGRLKKGNGDIEMNSDNEGSWDGFGEE